MIRSALLVFVVGALLSAGILAFPPRSVDAASSASFAFNATPREKALQTIAHFFGLTLRGAGQVGGRVTFTLRGVTSDQAIVAVLAGTGFRYHRSVDTVSIYMASSGRVAVKPSPYPATVFPLTVVSAAKAAQIVRGLRRDGSFDGDARRQLV